MFTNVNSVLFNIKCRSNASKVCLDRPASDQNWLVFSMTVPDLRPAGQHTYRYFAGFEVDHFVHELMSLEGSSNIKGRTNVLLASWESFR